MGDYTTRLPDREDMGTLLLTIRVRPNARESTLEQAADGTWRARLRQPPVDGKANAELVALVARYFGCARAAVTIRAGAGARIKRVRVAL
jgi:uncharacterized protein YggU (UPF0235/DUF167 family)